jgi:hypothetical protein
MCMPENIKEFFCVCITMKIKMVFYIITATYEHMLPVLKINTY